MKNQTILFMLRRYRRWYDFMTFNESEHVELHVRYFNYHLHVFVFYRFRVNFNHMPD